MRKAIAGFGLALALAVPVTADEPGNLVTIVTSDQPQVQLMAMVLTHQAMAQGKSARVLLCGAGGDMALAEAPETATAPQPPKGASPQGLLGAAIEKGATVEVCAIYLPGKGADPSALMDGVGVAKPPAMSTVMTAENTTIWSF